uniref:Uncharacterized protein n=1 Tax=Arundo donax TaxID=35708 RepID=A0A0A9C9S4_ARUDO
MKIQVFRVPSRTESSVSSQNRVFNVPSRTGLALHLLL